MRKSLAHGFTLTELLIVIGVIAVMVTVILVTLNPSKAQKKARDVKRIKDLNTLQSVVLSAQSDNLSLGAPKTVYISLPSSSTTCTDLNLPTLPSGYVYHCSSQDNLTKTDGTGWIPIDMKSGSSPLNTLPKDQRNKDSEGLYYAYITGDAPSDFKLTAKMEVGDSTNGSVYQAGGDTSSSSIPDTVSQSQDPLMQGLVGWWKFDEGSGTTAKDSSGNGNDGTINGQNYITGKTGNGLNFPENNNGIFIPASSSLVTPRDFTLVVWMSVRTTACYSNSCAVIRHGNDNNSNMDYAFSIDSGRCFNFAFTADGGQKTFGKYSGCLGDNWHNVAVVRNDTAKTVMFYVDGVAETPYYGSSYTGTIGNSSGQGIHLGGGLGGSGSYNGILDDLRIYNRALSDTEVKALYDATK